MLLLRSHYVLCLFNKWCFYRIRFGFNKWRDPLRPTQILSRICKDEGLDGPHFSTGRVKIDNKVFVAQSQIQEENGEFCSNKFLIIKRRTMAMLIPRVRSKECKCVIEGSLK